MALKELDIVDLSDRFLNTDLELIGLSDEQLILKAKDSTIIAVLICPCGGHFAFAEADQEDLEREQGPGAS